VKRVLLFGVSIILLLHFVANGAGRVPKNKIRGYWTLVQHLSKIEDWDKSITLLLQTLSSMLNTRPRPFT
jgi:hypothetical protein